MLQPSLTLMVYRKSALGAMQRSGHQVFALWRSREIVVRVPIYFEYSDIRDHPL